MTSINNDNDVAKDDIDAVTASSFIQHDLPGVVLKPQIQKDESGNEFLVFSAPLNEIVDAVALHKKLHAADGNPDNYDPQWAAAENRHWKILDMLKEGENVDDIIKEIAKSKTKGAKNIVGMVKKIVDDARIDDKEWRHAFDGLERMKFLRAAAVKPVALKLFKFRQELDWNKKQAYLEALAESMCHVRNWGRKHFNAEKPSDFVLKTSPDELPARVHRFLNYHFERDPRFKVNFSGAYDDNYRGHDMTNWGKYALYGYPARKIAEILLESAHESITMETVLGVLETAYGKLKN